MARGSVIAVWGTTLIAVIGLNPRTARPQQRPDQAQANGAVIKARLQDATGHPPRHLPAGCAPGRVRLWPLRSDSEIAYKGKCVAVDEALGTYHTSCEQGAARACDDLGLLYVWKLAPSPGPAKTAELFRKSCEAGSESGCWHLAVAYQRGDGVQHDALRAIDIYQKACKAGFAPACRDAGEAWDSMRDGSLSNGLAGMFMGAALQDGPSMSGSDYAEAAQLFEKQCRGGDGQACFSRAEMIEKEQTPHSPLLAIEMVTKSCSLGYPDGCAQLGSLFDPDSPAADPGFELKLYDLACAGGSGRGCASLGGIYRDGRGDAPDLDKAARAFEQACAARNADGCLALAQFRAAGKGGPADPQAAAALEQRACDLGSENACQLLRTANFFGNMAGGLGGPGK